MNPDKKIIVDQLLQRLNSAPYLVLVDYNGMSVPQFNEVRKRLRGVGANLHVTKNSYVKAAGEAKNYPAELQKDLTGQTAVVFGDKDVCAAAKVIAGVHKEFQRPVLKSGVLDGRFVSAAQVRQLADIGSRENMLGTLLGVLNAPASALARVIQGRVDKESGGAKTGEAEADKQGGGANAQEAAVPAEPEAAAPAEASAA